MLPSPPRLTKFGEIFAELISEDVIRKGSPSDPDDAERIYNALAEDGTVTVPLQETFWAVRYGWVTDRFGIPWTINCEEAE